MQSGQYITDRWMVRMIRDICKERGITLRTFSDDWLLELKKGEKTTRILGYKFSLNDSVASSIAQDKVAAYQLLATAEIPAVEHYLIRTKAGEAQWEPIVEEKMVIKPLTGTSGHGVNLHENVEVMRDVIATSGIEAWAISPFYEIKREVRLILLDNELLLAYEKQPVVQGGMKLFNLGKGARPVEYTPAQEVISLAQRAQTVLGLRLSAVDIIELASGEHMVLEVNDGIMMENFARFSKDNARSTKKVYESIIELLIQ